MESYLDRLEREKQHERNIFNPENILLTKNDLFSILDKSGMDYSKIKSKIQSIKWNQVKNNQISTAIFFSQ